MVADSRALDNQWQVNFNLSLESFEPHVEGTRHLIDFSAASAQHAPIFFTSSVGAVGEWRLKNGDILVPEESIDDFSVPGYSGYSESKYITERLLEVAGKQSGVCSAICRVGQIAGPVCFAESRMGMWNKQEWLPSVSLPSFNHSIDYTFELTSSIDYRQLKILGCNPELSRWKSR